LATGYSHLSVELDGRAAHLAIRGTVYDVGLSRARIEHGLTPTPRMGIMDLRWRSLRAEAERPAARERSRDAWLLIDRDRSADDNAEHRYRYLLRHRPDVTSFFVLREDSHDWPRLSEEGFRLIAF